MKKIISVSRRTDIPAWYGDWFIRRLREGFAGYINPFGKQQHIVDLKPETVRCFVFWSKNFAPFLQHLKFISDSGFQCLFHGTVTGLPEMFEPHSPAVDNAVKTLQLLSRMVSPKQVTWRYDPVILSSVTDFSFHRITFSRLAAALEGFVERCCFSYAFRYRKVERSYADFQRRYSVRIEDPDAATRLSLAEELAGIAEKHGIRLMTCSNDELIRHSIDKAHCIDGKLVDLLFPDTGQILRPKPSRKDCGCYESTDIGAYDTCPHGCVYCYANTGKETAVERFRRQDVSSAFLGLSSEEPDDRIRTFTENARFAPIGPEGS